MIIAIGGDNRYKAELPATPLVSGLSWDEGWEIPTLWAVTPDGLCWANDGHGGSLQDIPSLTLLGIVRGHHQETAVRRALGLKPRLPDWAAAALTHGWTPPASFNRDNFE